MSIWNKKMEEVNKNNNRNEIISIARDIIKYRLLQSFDKRTIILVNNG